MLLFLALIAVAFLAAALLCFPPACDAEFAMHDPVVHALNLDAHGLGSVSAHHPLYHFLHDGLARLLGAVGVVEPSFAALHGVSVVGGAGLVVLLVGAAGQGRRVVGLALALLLLGTRVIAVQVVSGENVLLGILPAAGALMLATRRPRAVRSLGALIVLSLLMRQDNLLALPGILTAFFFARPPEDRLMPAARLLAVTGLVTLGSYFAIWRFVTENGEFLPWLCGMAWEPEGEGLRSFSRVGESAPWRVHLDALGVGLFGRQALQHEVHGYLGLAWIAALFAVVVRRAPRGPIVAGVLVALLFRHAFYLWFEPTNSEWWILSLVFFALLALKGASASARSLGRRVGLLLLLATLTSGSHVQATWALRHRHLAELAESLHSVDRPGAVFLAHDPRVALALRRVGLKAEPLPLDAELSRARVNAVVLARTTDVLLVFDRHVRRCSPHAWRQGEGTKGSTYDHLGAFSDVLTPQTVHEELAALDASEGGAARFLRKDGRVWAVIWPGP